MANEARRGEGGYVEAFGSKKEKRLSDAETDDKTDRGRDDETMVVAGGWGR